MIIKLFFLISIFVLFESCTKQTVKESVLKKNSIDLQVQEAYEEGVKALEGGDALYAAKKFNEAEILFPQSIWAPKSALMAAYAYYSQDYYGDTIAELRRFIKLYPMNKNLDYAYYLLAISYYEQIVAERKDLQPIINAQKIFDKILLDYPTTSYDNAAHFPRDLINDLLAST